MCVLLACVLLTVTFPAHAKAPPPPGWSAWLSYWDLGNVPSEIALLGDALDEVGLFAAYFDRDDRLFVPDELLLFLEENQQTGFADKSVCLTIVNDVQLDENQSLLKDRPLLARLMLDGASQARHAEDILRLAKTLRVDGIQLDYENLGTDTALWKAYAQFIAVMQARAQAEGIRLQVVLEPSALEKVTFPDGPAYIVMFYNLFGAHSGPGPKADVRFIQTLALRAIKNLPSLPAAAFATGGFLWDSQGVRALRETDAVNWLEDANAIPQRDANSGALYHQGVKDGRPYELWFADAQTIRRWQEAASNAGIPSFYLWLLGGNEPQTLTSLSE